ncbi:DNA-binding protein [Streptomyces naganishii JCM 4654]|uniref:DNA-binding protein n=1 Tax=Streptomyces naganishii JCM 4654 TaxID=1306179 RepID=A0A918Y6H0_9ACTN|nr:DNA-binding protein [Streptomyces naganishii JCM 4654]
MTGADRFDLPEPDAFTRAYWDATAKGRLLVRRCGACGLAHHPPREFCPYCWSEDVTWEPASGRAALYTWSVVHRNDLPPFSARTPYVAAVVELPEGPRMMTEVVGAGDGGGGLWAGMDLEVAFRAVGERREHGERGEYMVPVFRPVSGGGRARGVVQ